MLPPLFAAPQLTNAPFSISVDRSPCLSTASPTHLAAGYVAYTGHVFTHATADVYTRERYEPTKAVLLNKRHQLFVAIATKS